MLRQVELEHSYIYIYGGEKGDKILSWPEKLEGDLHYFV